MDDGDASTSDVDGASLDIDGTRFTICPWWDGPQTRDAVGELDRPRMGVRPDGEEGEFLSLLCCNLG